MFANPKSGITCSILIIALGVAWLMNTLNIFPGVDWLWSGSIGLCGILLITWCGLNRVTFVWGLFLINGSVFSVLRQTRQIQTSIEVPALFITFGVLLLLAHLLPLKSPDYLKNQDPL